MRPGSDEVGERRPAVISVAWGAPSGGKRHEGFAERSAVKAWPPYLGWGKDAEECDLREESVLFPGLQVLGIPVKREAPVRRAQTRSSPSGALDDGGGGLLE